MLPILALLAVAYAHPEQLVETEWVAEAIAANGTIRGANVRIVDMRQSGYPEGHRPRSCRRRRRSKR